MIGWRDEPWCATMLYMRALDQANATIAAMHAKRVATDLYGRILISPTSTHLLARRALGGVWA